jgi:hypothetical protein
MADEDTECTLVFVDMLGFANLVQKFPTRLIHSGPNEAGFTGSSTSPASNMFIRFHRIVDTRLFDHSFYGSARAMLFSDCAFLEFGNSLLAVLAAVELMRKLILEKVPVRMGIGRGTFYPLKFSTDITGPTIINRSLFVGTAVVRAHFAEQCGGKGLRIFVHPSLEEELGVFRSRIKAIGLVPAFPNAKWELDFLYEQRPAQQKPSADDDDSRLFGLRDEEGCAARGLAPLHRHGRSHESNAESKQQAGYHWLNRTLQSVVTVMGLFLGL